MKKATQYRASSRLMAELPRISAELAVTGLFQPNTGRLGGIDASLLRELGAILHNVQVGMDARKLFRQDSRTKPKKDRSGLAFVYYYLRAIAPGFSEQAALDCIKGAPALKAPASDDTIRKEAQKLRDKTLDALERMSAAEAGEKLLLVAFNYDIAAWRPEWELAPGKVKALRAHLRKKSAHIRD